MNPLSTLNKDNYRTECKKYKEFIKQNKQPEIVQLHKDICSILKQYKNEFEQIDDPQSILYILRLLKETVILGNQFYINLCQSQNDGVIFVMQQFAVSCCKGQPENYGKQIFSDTPSEDQKVAGKSVAILLLENIQVWASWFKIDTQTGQLSNYSRIYQNLQEQGFYKIKTSHSYYKEEEKKKFQAAPGYTAPPIQKQQQQQQQQLQEEEGEEYGEDEDEEELEEELQLDDVGQAILEFESLKMEIEKHLDQEIVSKLPKVKGYVEDFLKRYGSIVMEEQSVDYQLLVEKNIAVCKEFLKLIEQCKSIKIQKLLERFKELIMPYKLLDFLELYISTILNQKSQIRKQNQQILQIQESGGNVAGNQLAQKEKEALKLKIKLLQEQNQQFQQGQQNHKQEMKQLESKIILLTGQLEEKESELVQQKELQSKLQTKNQSQQDLSIQNKDLQNQIGKLQQKITRLQEENSEFSQQMNNNKSQDKTIELQQQIQKLKQQMNDQQENYEEQLRVEKQKTQQNFQQNNQEQQQLEEYMIKVQKQSREIGNLQNEVNSLTEKLKNIQQQNQEFQDKNEQINMQLKQKENELKLKNNQIRNLQSEISKLEREINQKENGVGAQDAQQLQSELNLLKGKYQNQSEELNLIQSSHAIELEEVQKNKIVLEKQVQQVKKDVLEKEEQVKQLQQKLQKIEQINEENNQSGYSSQDIQKIKVKNYELEEENKILKSDIQEKDQEIQELKKKIEKLKGDLSKTNAELKLVKEQINANNDNKENQKKEKEEDDEEIIIIKKSQLRDQAMILNSNTKQLKKFDISNGNEEFRQTAKKRERSPLENNSVFIRKNQNQKNNQNMNGNEGSYNKQLQVSQRYYQQHVQNRQQQLDNQNVQSGIKLSQYFANSPNQESKIMYSTFQNRNTSNNQKNVQFSNTSALFGVNNVRSQLFNNNGSNKNLNNLSALNNGNQQQQLYQLQQNKLNVKNVYELAINKQPVTLNREKFNLSSFGDSEQIVRFQKSCLRHRYPIFVREGQITVGMLIQRDQEQIEGDRSVDSVLVQLFFTNKSHQPLYNLKFVADYSRVLQNEMVMDTLNVGVQSKMDLKIDFVGDQKIINAYLSYIIGSHIVNEKIYIPNTMLLFTEQQEIQSDIFESKWIQCAENVRVTEPLLLQKQVADSIFMIKKKMDLINLSQAQIFSKTSPNQFFDKNKIENGSSTKKDVDSYKDVELGGFFILRKTNTKILLKVYQVNQKQVVFQGSFINTNQAEYQYHTYVLENFLQTMIMIFTEQLAA